MALSTCRFCEHANPVNSKFCSECGGSLHLLPCPGCGAVSNVTASTCYQCGIQLPGLKTDTLALPSTAAEIARPFPYRYSRVIVGTVVLAAFASLVYYIYHQRALVDATQPSDATSEPRGRASPANAGIIRQDAPAMDALPADANNRAHSAGTVTSLPETPLAGATPAAVNELRIGRRPVESREAKAGAGTIAGTPAIDRGSVSERALPAQACTEAAATLGLCATKAVQNKVANTAVVTKAPIARTREVNAGETGKSVPPRRDACTEARTALGLCAPTPIVPAVTHTQRKE